jgi:2'-5' RNA ligase
MSHLTETLERTRQDFLAAGHTMPNVRRDFPEWHRGRPRYALWALMVDLPHLRDLLGRAARELAPWLLDDYQRQPHITLALAGFPTPTPTQPDDYGPEDLARHRAALAAGAPPPFEICIGAPSSFSSAPFLSVEDPEGGIARLRQLLDDRPHPGGGPYVPHLTLGLYGGAYPCGPVLQRLLSLVWPSVRLRVDRLTLLEYRADVIGGQLMSIDFFSLMSKR